LTHQWVSFKTPFASGSSFFIEHAQPLRRILFMEELCRSLPAGKFSYLIQKERTQYAPDRLSTLSLLPVMLLIMLAMLTQASGSFLAQFEETQTPGPHHLQRLKPEDPGIYACVFLLASCRTQISNLLTEGP